MSLPRATLRDHFVRVCHENLPLYCNTEAVLVDWQWFQSVLVYLQLQAESFGFGPLAYTNENTDNVAVSLPSSLPPLTEDDATVPAPMPFASLINNTSSSYRLISPISIYPYDMENPMFSSSLSSDEIGIPENEPIANASLAVIPWQLWLLLHAQFPSPATPLTTTLESASSLTSSPYVTGAALCRFSPVPVSSVPFPPQPHQFVRHAFDTMHRHAVQIAEVFPLTSSAPLAPAPLLQSLLCSLTPLLCRLPLPLPFPATIRAPPSYPLARVAATYWFLARCNILLEAVAVIEGCAHVPHPSRSTPTSTPLASPTHAHTLPCAPLISSLPAALARAFLAAVRTHVHPVLAYRAAARATRANARTGTSTTASTDTPTDSPDAPLYLQLLPPALLAALYAATLGAPVSAHIHMYPYYYSPLLPAPLRPLGPPGPHPPLCTLLAPPAAAEAPRSRYSYYDDEPALREPLPPVLHALYGLPTHSTPPPAAPTSRWGAAAQPSPATAAVAHASTLSADEHCVELWVDAASPAARHAAQAGMAAGADDLRAMHASTAASGSTLSSALTQPAREAAYPYQRPISGAGAATGTSAPRDHLLLAASARLRSLEAHVAAQETRAAAQAADTVSTLNMHKYLLATPQVLLPSVMDMSLQSLCAPAAWASAPLDGAAADAVVLDVVVAAGAPGLPMYAAEDACAPEPLLARATLTPGLAPGRGGVPGAAAGGDTPGLMSTVRNWFRRDPAQATATSSAGASAATTNTTAAWLRIDTLPTPTPPTLNAAGAAEEAGEGAQAPSDGMVDEAAAVDERDKGAVAPAIMPSDGDRADSNGGDADVVRVSISVTPLMTSLWKAAAAQLFPTDTSTTSTSASTSASVSAPPTSSSSYALSFTSADSAAPSLSVLTGSSCFDVREYKLPATNAPTPYQYTRADTATSAAVEAEGGAAADADGSSYTDAYGDTDSALPSSSATNAPMGAATNAPATLTSATYDVTTTNTDTSARLLPFPVALPSHRRGLVGLRNLGNTCFMNSIIQCVSNTPRLTALFLQHRRVLKQVNTDNPLGHGGRVVRAWSTLMQHMWSGASTVTAPVALKRVLGEVSAQFQGTQQHDAQELLSFLLDGLHEDVNRVKRKPIVPAVESEGKTDEQVAQESWEGHRRRNDSVIVDTCQGLLKTTSCCLACGHNKVKFEPYMTLSVPVPVKRMSVKRVRLVRSHPGCSDWLQVLQRTADLLHARSDTRYLPQLMEVYVSLPESATVADMLDRLVASSAEDLDHATGQADEVGTEVAAADSDLGVDMAADVDVEEGKGEVRFPPRSLRAYMAPLCRTRLVAATVSEAAPEYSQVLSGDVTLGSVRENVITVFEVAASPLADVAEAVPPADADAKVETDTGVGAGMDGEAVETCTSALAAVTAASSSFPALVKLVSQSQARGADVDLVPMMVRWPRALVSAVDAAVDTVRPQQRWSGGRGYGYGRDSDSYGGGYGDSYGYSGQGITASGGTYSDALPPLVLLVPVPRAGRTPSSPLQQQQQELLLSLMDVLAGAVAPTDAPVPSADGDLYPAAALVAAVTAHLQQLEDQARTLASAPALSRASSAQSDEDMSMPPPPTDVLDDLLFSAPSRSHDGRFGGSAAAELVLPAAGAQLLCALPLLPFITASDGVAGSVATACGDNAWRAAHPLAQLALVGAAVGSACALAAVSHATNDHSVLPSRWLCVAPEDAGVAEAEQAATPALMLCHAQPHADSVDCGGVSGDCDRACVGVVANDGVSMAADGSCDGVRAPPLSSLLAEYGSPSPIDTPSEHTPEVLSVLPAAPPSPCAPLPAAAAQATPSTSVAASYSLQQPRSLRAPVKLCGDSLEPVTPHTPITLAAYGRAACMVLCFPHAAVSAEATAQTEPQAQTEVMTEGETQGAANAAGSLPRTPFLYYDVAAPDAGASFGDTLTVDDFYDDTPAAAPSTTAFMHTAAETAVTVPPPPRVFLDCSAAIARWVPVLVTDTRALHAQLSQVTDAADNTGAGATTPLLQLYVQARATKAKDTLAQRALSCPPLTLARCLAAFTDADKLTGNNQVYCGQCKAFTDSTQQASVFTLPDVLFIHLKRFQYVGYRSNKVDDEVLYPRTGLDAAQLLLGNTPARAEQVAPVAGDDGHLYDLMAVSIHHGSASYGHYVAVARNLITGHWHRYDDSSVSPIPATQAQQSDAYVLVYQRRSATRQLASHFDLPTRVPE